MDEADFLCDKLAIMNRGKIAAIGKPEELKARVAKQRYIGIVINEDGLIRKLADELGGSVDGRVIVVSIRGMNNTIARVHAGAKKLHATVLSIKTLDPSLDDVFVAVTRGGKWV
jgi:ABC-2 type transport system ATP-binding protein